MTRVESKPLKKVAPAALASHHPWTSLICSSAVADGWPGKEEVNTRTFRCVSRSCVVASLGMVMSESLVWHSDTLLMWYQPLSHSLQTPRSGERVDERKVRLIS